MPKTPIKSLTLAQYSAFSAHDQTFRYGAELANTVACTPTSRCESQANFPDLTLLTFIFRQKEKCREATNDDCVIPNQKLNRSQNT